MWQRKALRSNEQHARRRIAELTESRRTIVEAFEIERQRLERDLHDGAQQYFVAAAMKLGELEYDLQDTTPDIKQQLKHTRHLLEEGIASLRHTVHGIHPQVLSDRGLEAAVRDMAARYGDHVQVRCPNELPPMPTSVMAAAYFFIAETLTNAAKHAPGATVSVLIVHSATLRITVVDTGPGGATLGLGLRGMSERLAAFDGRMELISPPGGPTTVAASIPMLLGSAEGEQS